MSQRALAQLIGLGIILFVLVIGGSQATYVVDPGHRGVLVTLGKVSEEFLPEGFGFKPPFISRVQQIQIRQQTRPLNTDAYSADLQQITIQLRVLYRIPQDSVVRIFRDYAGEPFEALISPRVNEALKEVVATRSAESMVQNREDVKNRTLEAARLKVTELIEIVDVNILDIALSPELEAAIEAKMVQEQEAAKARFVQQRTEIEAQTAIIRARGEAESIEIRGRALQENPTLIQLQIVEKWDGRSPLVIGGGAEGGANVLLPIQQPAR
ncbi:MAG: prohibitin family protein [Puniceicoccaceae bacterium]|nr:MAG: prohibitin family protein [Puniceicoccaceae bacterium]